MSKKDIGKPIITLTLDTGERSFMTIEDIRIWAIVQREAFSWLKALHVRTPQSPSSPAGHSWPQFNTWINQVESFVASYKQELSSNDQPNFNSINSLKEIFENSLNNGQLQTTESPNIQFVFALRENHSDEIAGYALQYLMGMQFNLTVPSAKEGVLLAFQFKQGNKDTIEAAKSAFEETQNSWSGKFSAKHELIHQQNEELISEVDKIRGTYAEMATLVSGQLTQQQNEFAALIEKSNNTIDELEVLYNKKLALQASVRYWKNKLKTHTIGMSLAGVLMIFFALGTVVLFLDVAGKYLDTTIDQVKLWQIGIVIVVSTFGIWLTRLMSKIFISNLHLRTDASERVTMMVTYIAMLRDETGLENDERKLILQTLFRPSSTGYIKDEGPSGIADIFSKFGSNK